MSYAADSPVLGKVVADVDGKGDEETRLQQEPLPESEDEGADLDAFAKCCFFLQVRTEFWDDAREHSRLDLETFSEMILLSEKLVAAERVAESAKEFVRGLLHTGLLEDAQEAEDGDGDEDADALLRWSRRVCLAQYGDEMLQRWPVSDAVGDDAEPAAEERSLYDIGTSMVEFLGSLGCVTTETQELEMNLYLLRVRDYLVDSGLLVRLTPGENDITKDMYRKSEVDESRFAEEVDGIVRRLLGPAHLQRTLEAKTSAPPEPLDLKKAKEVGQRPFEKQSEKEIEFWEYFGRLICEWNPCRDDEGEFRYVWDAEVGAHDVQVVCGECGEKKNPQPMEPERTRLREVLDQVFGNVVGDEPLDLEPVRRLVARLVESSGRHIDHGKEPPKIGVHPCAQGSGKCPVCRYGFPHQRFGRGGKRKMRLEKGERLGSWYARFARNDAHCNSYEPHLLLANLGNVDWRPCLNLWAVIEYVTKYATKAPKGSKRLGDVLKAAVDEVCNYGKEGEGVDLLRQSLQKVFARTLGDRDFHLFEAVHLGLGLPQVFELLPTVALNTYGTRALKPGKVIAEQGDDQPISYDSKVEKFDRRLEILRKQNRGLREPAIAEAEIRDVSLYEFYWKYYVYKGRVSRCLRPVALVVTPSISADCANVTHDRHEMYARTCVVAYWRHMPTAARAKLYKDSGMPACDEIRFGATEFRAPFLGSHGALEPGRYLGVQDLLRKFDNDWATALMEMLVDPVLGHWVPQYVCEQFERWNPFFRECLADALLYGEGEEQKRKSAWIERAVARGVSDEVAQKRAEKLPRRKKKIKSNAQLLRVVRREMVRMHEKQVVAEQAGKLGGEGLESDGDDSGAGEPESTDSDDDPQIAALRAREEEEEGNAKGGYRHQDPVPSFGDGTGVGNDVEGDEWSRAGAVAQVSAAGPAEAAADQVVGTVGSSARVTVGEEIAGVVNPAGYDWVGCNVVQPARADEWKGMQQRWHGTSVRDDDADAPVRDDLDVWQKFLYDIVDFKARELEDLEKKGRRLEYKALRLICAGSSGTGKTRAIRSIVKRRRWRARQMGRLEEEVAFFLMEFLVQALASEAW